MGACPKRYCSAGHTRRDAMFDRILDQGLKKQRRNGERTRVGGDVDRHGQTFFKPRMLDLEIGSDEVDFLAER